MKLRLTGYRGQGDEVEEFIDLENLNIEVDAEAMLELRAFLDKAIQDLARLGERFSHLHLQDHSEAWRNGMPDIVIHMGNP